MNHTDPTALWQHLVQWQPAAAAALAQHVRALPDDWPLRVFGVGRPDAALLLPPGATGEAFPDRAPEIAPYDDIAPLDDCPACSEAEGNCRFHEGLASGHQEEVQAQLDAVKARPDIGLREFLRWRADVAEAEDRGEEPPAMPAAVSAVVSPPTSLAELRDRIAEALIKWAFRGKTPGHSGILETVRANAYSRADAVLSVLPEQAGEIERLRTMYEAASAREHELIEERDRLLEAQATLRAAAFREAADALGRMDYDTDSQDYGYDTYRDAWNGGVMDGADKLRRLAAEAQQQPDAETPHSCHNCSGIDPDTCLMNPDRPAPAPRQPAADEEHVCKPGTGLYWCPTSGQTESDCHGGFDVCCDRPDLHRPIAVQQPAAADGEETRS